MSAADQALIESTSSALMFADSPTANDFLVGLNFETPRYSASIAAEARVEGKRLREAYR